MELDILGNIGDVSSRSNCNNTFSEKVTVTDSFGKITFASEALGNEGIDFTVQRPSGGNVSLTNMSLSDVVLNVHQIAGLEMKGCSTNSNTIITGSSGNVSIADHSASATFNINAQGEIGVSASQFCDNECS